MLFKTFVREVMVNVRPWWPWMVSEVLEVLTDLIHLGEARTLDHTKESKMA